MNKVWVTGDAVVDLIPDSSTTYLKCPGGAPANVAVAIARLAGNSEFLGRVGNDPMGRFMAKTLKDEGVGVDKLLLDPNQRTSTVVVDLDDHGERSFTFMVKPSADQFFSTSDIPEFANSEWLHTCSIALANEPSRSATFSAMAKIQQQGGYVSFDPNLREEVWRDPSEIRSIVMRAVQQADVLKFSDDELEFLTGENDIELALKALNLAKEKLVIVTLGAKGALVHFAGQQKTIAGRAIKPVDTTGAGDAFVGGLLAKLSREPDWQQWGVVEQAVKWGNACGALATTQKGAMTALPKLTQLQQMLSE